MGRTLSSSFLLCISLIVGCGDDGGGDGSTDGAVVCSTADDCDDGRFCNGTETCDPEASSEPTGCVAGTPPCSGSCSEADRTCDGECPDRDGDGARDIACGGSDCDDDDDDAYPGNLEVCDAAGHDEDCNPDTLGVDEDGDGYESDECCNVQGDGSLLCGQDCNDDSSDINPESVDQCGSGDQDCDGDIDEEPELTFYRDIDGDGFGVPGDTVMACGAPSGYALLDTDCNDMFAAHNPSARETCDLEEGETPDPLMHDQDCDGAVDEGCACREGSSRNCGGPEALAMTGVCRPGTQACVDMPPAGTEWGSCSSIEPSDEVCNGQDDDCDGTVDETFACVQNVTDSGTNACGNPGTRRCAGDCTWLDPAYGTTETLALCNYCDDTGMMSSSERSTFATDTDTVGITDSGHILEGEAYTGGDSYYIVSAGSSTRGSMTSAPFTLGHGDATIDATVSVWHATAPTPGEGWAVYLVEDSGTSYLGATSPLGVPSSKNGLSAEWYFYRLSSPSNGADSGAMRHLRMSASDPTLGTTETYVAPDLNSGDPSPRSQRIRVFIQPDRVETPGNDTVVRAQFGVDDRASVQCGGTSPACPFRLTPGSRYRWGISAATSGSRRASVYWSIFEASPREIEVTGLCP